jgi:hypothetical protein
MLEVTVQRRPCLTIADDDDVPSNCARFIDSERAIPSSHENASLTELEFSSL